MKCWIPALALCVATATSITDTTAGIITVVGDAGDGQIGVDGSVAGISWEADRTGTGGNNNRGLALIYFFELPTLSSQTMITNAELEFEYVEKTNTPEFSADLFGVDARSNPSIQSSDYYDGDAASSSDTLIQTGMVTPSTSLGHLGVANHNSLNFVKSLYNADGTPTSSFARSLFARFPKTTAGHIGGDG